MSKDNAGTLIALLALGGVGYVLWKGGSLAALGMPPGTVDVAPRMPVQGSAATAGVSPSSAAAQAPAVADGAANAGIRTGDTTAALAGIELPPTGGGLPGGQGTTVPPGGLLAGIARITSPAAAAAGITNTYATLNPAGAYGPGIIPLAKAALGWLSSKFPGSQLTTNPQASSPSSTGAGTW